MKRIVAILAILLSAVQAYAQTSTVWCAQNVPAGRTVLVDCPGPRIDTETASSVTFFHAEGEVYDGGFTGKLKFLQELDAGLLYYHETGQYFAAANLAAQNVYGQTVMAASATTNIPFTVDLSSSLWPGGAPAYVSVHARAMVTNTDTTAAHALVAVTNVSYRVVGP